MQYKKLFPTKTAYYVDGCGWVWKTLNTSNPNSLSEPNYSQYLYVYLNLCIKHFFICFVGEKIRRKKKNTNNEILFFCLVEKKIKEIWRENLNSKK